ncbi:hypothetical protein EAO27_11090 [Sphingopyxis sp. YF1]|uniref:hypothetical protein n=1 Tax=Sphingopyxis sp. YF1 TaxID=2482763 RepID=UPI001F621292|nr:hypothetical protein [Sphingopyxis sp. YF1]UNU43196.1 hypothetical protein EAO27_11090 [Sphingopyxis sp. YF1]
MENLPPDPADIPAPASYHWTPRLQREFLESFATTGSVKISAARVGMSPAAVYQLKQRPQGAAFKLGCAAAVLIARGRLVDELLDRAIWGHDEMTTVMREEDRSLYKRRRIDSRLGLAMLARLDRMVETRAPEKGEWPGEAMLAQLVAGDWPGFLSLFDAAEAARAAGAAHATARPGEDAPGLPDDGAPDHAPDCPGTARVDDASAGGMAAALALWLAGCDNRANPLATLWKDSAIANEVAQFSAVSDPDPHPGPQAEPTPEEEAAAMTVWYDEEQGEWRTNFPPPDDYLGDEEGRFGEEEYERTLDPDEEEAWDAAHARACAPLRRAGEAARRAFFALPDPANDPAAPGASGASGAGAGRAGPRTATG